MAIIITYDIPSKHVEFKKAMFQLGYKDRIPNPNCSALYFPNTTLFHSNKTPANARDEARVICAQLGIVLERCISTQWTPDWAAICGNPFN